MFKLTEPLVLVGMMGCGKSAIGARLAKELGCSLYDCDKLIEQEQGRSIMEIFSSDGEEYFRELEARKIADILELGAGVISTGGGAFNSSQTRANVKDRAISIWLNSDVEMIYSRIKYDKSRPLLQCDNPKAKLEELLNARKSFYCEADIHIDNSSGNIRDVTNNIIEELRVCDVS